MQPAAENLGPRRSAVAVSAASFAAALLFGAGLVVSGMTDPARVRAFLDVGGAWDPTLLFVMAGGVGVHAAWWRRLRRRATPLWGDAFHLPRSRAIDGRLLAGAALFGVGWGLAGLCPGPALVAAAAGAPAALVFVAALLAGMKLFGLWERRLRR